MHNTKGFTLLECLIVNVILGIIITVMMKVMIMANFKIAQINKAVADGNQVVAVSSTCTKLDGTYYGTAASDGNTLNVYTDNVCHSSFGTLNRLNNATWVNAATKNLWVVFAAGGQLKLLLVRY